jgi:hypothetical protein
MIKEFNLGAVQWTVEVNNDKLDDRNAYGVCFYDASKIIVQTKSEKVDRHPSAIEQTLYHEVVHAILDTMGKRDLSGDEEFVQQFSVLLHQFETTKK